LKRIASVLLTFCTHRHGAGGGAGIAGASIRPVDACRQHKSIANCGKWRAPWASIMRRPPQSNAVSWPSQLAAQRRFLHALRAVLCRLGFLSSPHSIRT
jgi:hypothetical protein